MWEETKETKEKAGEMVVTGARHMEKRMYVERNVEETTKWEEWKTEGRPWQAVCACEIENQLCRMTYGIQDGSTENGGEFGQRTVTSTAMYKEACITE